MSEFNLDAYLTSLQADGTSQGEGCFTISHEKAALKRSQYTLVREQSWVLRLVQAAVRWNCTDILIRQSRTLSTFQFLLDDPTTLPELEELIQALLLADFESSQPEHCLATALRVVVERSHLSFLLGVDNGVSNPQSIYAGVHFGEMNELVRKRVREDWVPGLTLAIHHIPHTETNRLLLNLVPFKAYGLPMMSELVTYSYFSPIPITLDGLRIDGLFRNSALGWSYRQKPLLVQGLNVEEHPPMRVPSDCFNRSFTMRSSRPSDGTGPGTSAEYAAYFVLSGRVSLPSDYAKPRPASRLIWVRDGVIVSEESFETIQEHLGMYIFVSAEGLKTDLTGSNLRHDEQYLGRKKAIFEAAAESIDQLLAEDSNPCASDPSFDPYAKPFPSDKAGKGLINVLKHRIENSQKYLTIDEGFQDLKRCYSSELENLLYLLRVYEREEQEAEYRRLAPIRKEEARAKRELEEQELSRLESERLKLENLAREQEELQKTKETSELLKPSHIVPNAEPTPSATRTPAAKATARNLGINPQWLEKIRKKAERRAEREAAEKAGRAYEPLDLENRKYLS